MLRKIVFIITVTCMPNTFSTYLGRSPLIQAIAAHEDPRAIRRMIAEGANVNEVDCEFLRWYKPVLRYALDRGTDQQSVEIIQMLIEAGADINEKTYNRINDIRLYGMMPLLTYAVLYSSAEIVQILIKAGAQDIIIDPQDAICFKKSAFAIAQELGKSEIAQILAA